MLHGHPVWALYDGEKLEPCTKDQIAFSSSFIFYFPSIRWKIENNADCNRNRNNADCKFEQCISFLLQTSFKVHMQSIKLLLFEAQLSKY